MPARTTTEPNIHDYRDHLRGWGHDLTFSVQNGGLQLKAMGWGDGLRNGDYMILSNRESCTVYEICTVKYERDPSDMWSTILQHRKWATIPEPDQKRILTALRLHLS